MFCVNRSSSNNDLSALNTQIRHFENNGRLWRKSIFSALCTSVLDVVSTRFPVLCSRGRAADLTYTLASQHLPYQYASPVEFFYSKIKQYNALKGNEPKVLEEFAHHLRLLQVAKRCYFRAGFSSEIMRWYTYQAKEALFAAVGRFLIHNNGEIDHLLKESHSTWAASLIHNSKKSEAFFNVAQKIRGGLGTMWKAIRGDQVIHLIGTSHLIPGQLLAYEPIMSMIQDSQMVFSELSTREFPKNTDARTCVMDSTILRMAEKLYKPCIALESKVGQFWVVLKSGALGALLDLSIGCSSLFGLVLRFGVDCNWNSPKRILPQALLDDRNRAWESRIVAAADQHRRIAVVAGALHMNHGDASLVRLLERRGWQVERVLGSQPWTHSALDWRPQDRLQTTIQPESGIQTSLGTVFSVFETIYAGYCCLQLVSDGLNSVTTVFNAILGATYFGIHLSKGYLSKGTRRLLNTTRIYLAGVCLVSQAALVVWAYMQSSKLP